MGEQGRGSLIARSPCRASQYLSSCLPASLVVSTDQPERSRGRNRSKSDEPHPASPALFATDLGAGDLLTVEAEHKVPAEKTEEKAREEVEREYAHVKREITLPPIVELAKAEAIYHNGVLEIHVPRKPEVVPRRIEVKT